MNCELYLIPSGHYRVVCAENTIVVISEKRNYFIDRPYMEPYKKRFHGWIEIKNGAYYVKPDQASPLTNSIPKFLA